MSGPIEGGFERWGRWCGGKRARRDVGGGRIARSISCRVEVRVGGDVIGAADKEIEMKVVFVCLVCLARRSCGVRAEVSWGEGCGAWTRQ